jgi:hypothetical protein
MLSSSWNQLAALFNQCYIADMVDRLCSYSDIHILFNEFRIEGISLCSDLLDLAVIYSVLSLASLGPSLNSLIVAFISEQTSQINNEASLKWTEQMVSLMQVSNQMVTVAFHKDKSLQTTFYQVPVLFRFAGNQQVH